jgi:hypothetical protein
MGALGKIDTMSIIGVIGGAFLGKFVNKVIPDTMNPKLVAGGKMVLGLALPMVIKGKSHNLMQSVGNGILAVGSIELLTEFGVISGLDENDELAVAIEGIQDVSFEDLDGTINADVLSDDDVPVINADVLSGGDVPVINGSWED